MASGVGFTVAGEPARKPAIAGALAGQFAERVFSCLLVHS